MKILADKWAAAGSIATGIGAIAAFLAIVVTVVVYRYQSRGNKAAVIRQNLQFIHSLQTQVTRSIETGFLATINRQIREFRARLGPDVEPGYFLDQLFGSGQASGDRSLFLASALDSNLSSTMYTRMSDLWDRMSMTAFEFRGALCIFSYASQVLTQQARRLCAPENTTRILDTMAKGGARGDLRGIHNLDELVNSLLSEQIKLASDQLKIEENGIRQGCKFIKTLADKTLRLSDKELLKLASKKLASKHTGQPGFGELDNNPRQVIEKSLDHLRPTLPDDDVTRLGEIVGSWDPRSADALLAESFIRPKRAPDLRR